jgi:uncharacterized protein
MQVVVTGSSGLIGSALVSSLERAGHRVLRLVRRPPRGALEAHWDPAAGTLDPAPLEGVEAVIHLAGESIARLRWTAAVKARVRDSRVLGTRLLSERLAGLGRRPRVLVSASAVGWYGNRGDEVLDESAGPGAGFLAAVADQWERAADPARAAGIRVAHSRFALVLAARGGVLARLLPVFRFGLGGPVGSGRQWWSWVSLTDTVAALHHLIASNSLSGPVNVAAPAPATNREFARVLGRVVGRPAVLPAPAFVFRLIMGDMAEETVLASARIVPARLRASGYEFRHVGLEPALRHELGAAAASRGER